MYVQDVLQTLNHFWVSRGCLLWTPYHTEVGAGTSNPATFLRVLGPEPWWVAYTEPSIRPTDGRYGENPNRLQHYFQYQCILKPSPPDVQELFLQSLEALGLDLTKHDFRFVEDNWQSPSLGAWGLGWEAWLDGMEILQFTYFQECGGIKLDVRACELTYGIERIAMYLQGVESVYDLKWAPSGITYGDIFHAQEIEYCKYNFDAADTEKLFNAFDMWEAEGQQLLDKDLVLPAYDHCLRLSHLFNVLDARGAFSVSERGRFLLRCRAIAEQCAKGYLAQRQEMEFPLRRFSYPGKDDVGTPVDADISTNKEPDALLLEIGVEELPHGDVKTVERHVPKLVDRLFAEAGLDHGDVTTWITPRRIAFRIENVPPRQEDVTKQARGPKKSVAKDKDGHWTIPAQKFAEANGATTDDIYFAEQGKFEYCFVKALQKGKSLDELLSGILPKLLRAIPFGKSMGWQDSTVTFSRPVRWLLVLHGGQLVPLSWKLRDDDEIGPERRIYADRVTYGHRRLGASELTVAKADDYVATLRDGLVCVDRAEREVLLRDGVQALCDQHGLVPEDDAELFDEIVDLCEWPEPIVGSIPEDALVLPEAIIITPMKVHQRYIPLREKDGSLSKHFVAVANGKHDAEGLDLIRVGNERVLNARLRDAKYFWDTDTKQPLSKFAEGLSRVMFHQKLGSVADKLERLRNLYAALKDQLPTVDDGKMQQTLTLMKADLTTQMVFEFDSLEGVVGKLYAEKEGIDQDVADAILEHRLPRRADDKLPAGALGIVAGVLDRLDTLAGYFGIGVRVKGTSDPFGLRRNALALLSIASATDLDLDLGAFFKAALETYGHMLHDGHKALRDILDFFKDRQDVMARDDGYPYDQVAAALSCHAEQPLQLRRCLEALKGIDDKTMQDLAEQAKRIQRIAVDPAPDFDHKLLEDNEKALYGIACDGAERLRVLVEQKDWNSALQEIVAWVPVIDKYFIDILVNHEDDGIRRNRHALLQGVFDAMLTVADFTAIEKREVEQD